MSDKPFNVRDKRHFTAEGAARDEAPDDQVPPPSGSRAGSLPGDEPVGAEGRAPRASTDPAGFGPFLLSLGAQAGMLLSGTEGSAPSADALEAARAIISILEMLQDKTQGWRTAEEDRILDGLLFELRMAYVQRSPGKTA